MQYRKTIALDKSQEKLLELIRSWTFSQMDTEDIQNFIWVEYYQAINNKIKQLENKWYIRRDDWGEYIALKGTISDVYYFPVIGFAQCGNIWDSIDEVRNSDTYAFSTKDLHIESSEELKKYFFICLRWESMLPTIDDNDLLLVRLQNWDCTYSDNTLVIHNWNPKIKKVCHNSDGTYTLFSLNPNFPSMNIDWNNDELVVVWVVKKIIKSI